MSILANHFPGPSNRALRRTIRTVIARHAEGAYQGDVSLVDAIEGIADTVALTAQGQAALRAVADEAAGGDRN